MLLLEDDLFVDQFAEEKLADPRVLDLAGRIECTHDPELDAFGSFQRRTRVEVRLEDGQLLSTVGETRGTPGNPLTRGDVVDKFRKVTERRLGRDAQEALIAVCDRLETLEDTRRLSSLLETSPH